MKAIWHLDKAKSFYGKKFNILRYITTNVLKKPKINEKRADFVNLNIQPRRINDLDSTYCNTINKKSNGYWNNQENIQNYLSELSQKLNLKTVNDWNNLKQKQIRQHGGRTLCEKYTMYEIKCFGFPKGKLKFKKSIINKKSPGYWDNKKNIQIFLEKIKEKYNLTSLKEWNLTITKKQIEKEGGSRLLKIYSLQEIKSMGVETLFKNDENLNFLSFQNIENENYWFNKENIENFLLQLKITYNLQTPEDWNKIQKKQIENQMGGRKLLKIYSLFDLKCMACPDGKYLFTLKSLQQKSFHFWDFNENIHDFLQFISLKYNLNSIEDWNRISKTQIIDNGGRGLLNKFSLDEIIKNQLDKGRSVSLFNKSLHGRSSQRWLFLQIQKLFPDDEIVEDYFHSEISRESSFPVQFDVFILSKKIAFEYHGKQHYEDIPSAFAPLEMYQFRDEEKEKICKQFGIQLIVIPYWWDNHIDSLTKTIQNKFNY